MKAAHITPDVVAYGAAMTACARGGTSALLQRGAELLNEMRSAGIKLDSHVYSSLITAAREAGDWQRAVQLLRVMEADGVAPNG
jgi:pentatricopeptide repeat protein